MLLATTVNFHPLHVGLVVENAHTGCLISNQATLRYCGDPSSLAVQDSCAAGSKLALHSAILIDVELVEKSQIRYQRADGSA